MTSRESQLHLIDAQIALLNEARIGCDINGIDRRDVESEIETWRSIREIVEKHEGAIRERDVLFCKALIATLDTKDIERVTKCFNEMRPDEEHGGEDGKR
jgi:hypothetical protein